MVTTLGRVIRDSHVYVNAERRPTSTIELPRYRRSGKAKSWRSRIMVTSARDPLVERRHSSVTCTRPEQSSGLRLRSLTFTTRVDTDASGASGMLRSSPVRRMPFSLLALRRLFYLVSETAITVPSVIDLHTPSDSALGFQVLEGLKRRPCGQLSMTETTAYLDTFSAPILVRRDADKYWVMGVPTAN